MEGSGEVKEETMPPGFRFHPTDEELITYYLVNKISDAKFTGKAIGDVDLNKCEPWDLPGIFCTLKCSFYAAYTHKYIMHIFVMYFLCI